MGLKCFDCFLKYSLSTKKECGHDDAIWTCAWGKRKITQKKSNEAQGNGVEPIEQSNGGDHGDEEIVQELDIIVTGGVDDLVKIWEYDSQEGSIKLKHKLGEHSLGVVSVALNPDATSKLYCIKLKRLIFYLFLYYRMRFKFFGLGDSYMGRRFRR